MTRLVEHHEDLGRQVPLTAVCDCSPERRTRKMPVWLKTETAEAIGRQLAGVLRGDLVVFTYRCKCRRTIAVTVDDLFSVSNEAFREAFEELLKD